MTLLLCMPSPACLWVHTASFPVIRLSSPWRLLAYLAVCQLLFEQENHRWGQKGLELWGTGAFIQHVELPARVTLGLKRQIDTWYRHDYAAAGIGTYRRGLNTGRVHCGSVDVTIASLSRMMSGSRSQMPNASRESLPTWD